MMPIFFHLESHLVILYLFFFNGLLIHWWLRSFSRGYVELTSAMEAQILASFFISILVNGAMLLSLDLLDVRFVKMQFLTPLLSVILFGLLLTKRRSIAENQVLQADWSLVRISIYTFVFIVLFYNGGLIELLADSWWHMSLASKIAAHNMLSIDFGHLNGVTYRYYPPLWHGNLALARTFSGEPMVVLWNSFTAWGAVLKVMGFYLFALALSKKKAIAIMSAVLFILLPGVGDSYLRVSAWPSHIGYMALFTALYAGFSLLDSRKIITNGGSLKSIVTNLVDDRAKLFCFIMLLVVILYSHQVELVWLMTAFLFYWIGVSIAGSLRVSAARSCEPAFHVVRAIGLILLLCVFAAALWFLFAPWSNLSSNNDLLLSRVLPVVFFSVMLFAQLNLWLGTLDTGQANIAKVLSIVLITSVGVLLVLSIDFRHFISLFDPSMAYPRGASHEHALVTTGWFGDALAIPGWHLQLRGGLLYSGIISLPLSILMAIYRPTRLTVFLASTGAFTFLFCVSPYLYQWLKDILSYHSPWRISIIIFHPIVFASAIYFVMEFISTARKNENV